MAAARRATAPICSRAIAVINPTKTTNRREPEPGRSQQDSAGRWHATSGRPIGSQGRAPVPPPINKKRIKTRKGKKKGNGHLQTLTVIDMSGNKMHFVLYYSNTNILSYVKINK